MVSRLPSYGEIFAKTVETMWALQGLSRSSKYSSRSNFLSGSLPFSSTLSQHSLFTLPVVTMQARTASYDNDVLEKGSPEHAEMAAQSSTLNKDYPNKGSDLEKKLLRRIDIRLIPALG